MSIFENAAWIWLKSRQLNQYVCFRKEFSLSDTNENKTLYISVDSDFVVYINGHQIGVGQFSDWPDKKSWSSFDVSGCLRPGKNIISVLGYWRGEDFFTYVTGEPGIIVKLGNVVTDESWKCIEHPAFQSGTIPKVTLQLGFTFCYDARKNIEWRNIDYDCSDWQNASIVQRSFPVTVRPVPPLTVKPPVSTKIVKQGTLLKTSGGQTVAEKMANRELILEEVTTSTFPVCIDSDCDRFLIIGLGGEQAGWLNFELEAATGTVLDIAHGEHLDDGRVRMHIDNRNFADRYICRSGKNTFEMPFRRLGCAFLELHISNAAEPVTINHFSIRPVEPPLPATSTFSCQNMQFMELRRAALKTMLLCMHEHYEDCPWREQGLYSYDSRMQMMFGYPVWGNYNFVSASLRLLRDGERPDGLLELCAPAKRMPMTIPIFAFAWGNQLWEHCLYSGNTALMVESIDTLDRMIESQYKNFDPATGLYHIPDSDELWHFYEWTDGMHSHDYTEDFHAAFNLYYLELLKNAVRIKQTLKHNTDDLELRISELTCSLSLFLNPEKSSYASSLSPDGSLKGYYECIQVMMLYHELVPEDITAELIDNILDGKFIEMMPGSLFYLAEALFKYGPQARTGAWNLILERFYPMLDGECDTLWEMREGADAFNRAGSLCHAWSGIPVWLAHAWLLGIRPLEPGFCKFSVSPFPADLTEASGEVVTPAGRIKVKWWIEEEKMQLELEHPAGLQPVFQPLPEMPFDPDKDIKITIVQEDLK